MGAAGLATVAIVVPIVGPNGAAAAVTATQAAATSVVPYTPYPSTGTDLYVDNQVVNKTSVCSDSGPGSESEPFCTIAEAASVVQPGETVVVEPGSYTGTTISVSGTAQAPITFDAIGSVTVEAVSTEPALTISGAHDVVLDGFSAVGTQRSFYVTGGSSGITINGGYSFDNSASTASIEVDGTTSDVTVSRMSVEARNPIEVDPGASGVVITGNSIQPDALNSWGVLVNGAPGTDVTGNTVHTECSGGISVEGASTGVTVENNIVQPTGFDCTRRHRHLGLGRFQGRLGRRLQPDRPLRWRAPVRLGRHQLHQPGRLPDGVRPGRARHRGQPRPGEADV